MTSRKPKNKQHYYKPFTQQNNIINITKDLSIYKITNCFHIKDVPPSHRLVVHSLSTLDHPQVEAMSPQAYFSLLVVHSPHLAT